MFDEKKTTPFDTVSERRTVRTPLHAHPSLLPLRIALTFAESESPARAPRVDANERRALQLISRMQSGHKKIFPFLNMMDDASNNQLQNYITKKPSS